MGKKLSLKLAIFFLENLAPLFEVEYRYVFHGSRLRVVLIDSFSPKFGEERFQILENVEIHLNTYRVCTDIIIQLLLERELYKADALIRYLVCRYYWRVQYRKSSHTCKSSAYSDDLIGPPGYFYSFSFLSLSPERC